MQVLGIDLAAQSAMTGAVVIASSGPDRHLAQVLAGLATDDRLVEAAREVEVIGVDAGLFQRGEAGELW